MLLLHENIKIENYISRNKKDTGYQAKTLVTRQKERHITIDITEIKIIKSSKMTLCQKFKNENKIAKFLWEKVLSK